MPDSPNTWLYFTMLWKALFCAITSLCSVMEWMQPLHTSETSFATCIVLFDRRFTETWLLSSVKYEDSGNHSRNEKWHKCVCCIWHWVTGRWKKSLLSVLLPAQRKRTALGAAAALCVHSIHWLVPAWNISIPLSASKLPHWEYANGIRHDRWFPLNFFFPVAGGANHRGREQEVLCRKPTAPLPPSAGPHFIWIINDRFFSFFLTLTQRRFGSLTCFCSSRKQPPARKGLLFPREGDLLGVYRQHQHAGFHEPSGSLQHLNRNVLWVTLWGNLSKCRSIKRNRFPVCLWELRELKRGSTLS